MKLRRPSSILDRLAPLARTIEAELDGLLPASSIAPRSLHQAMRYAVFGPGKRIRPILVLEAARMFDVSTRKALPFAAAVEFLHTYSLVHDDLPCMDDDDYRRGRPTCHKRFGEATAVLVGDALLTLAFGSISEGARRGKIADRKALDIQRELALAAGSSGLIGGQVKDLESEGKRLTGRELCDLHRKKTGALLVASIRIGAILGDPTPYELALISRFGTLFGRVFQMTDDILDVVGSFETLGKPIGSDERNRKATAVSLMGIDRARKSARDLARKARAALDRLEGRGARNFPRLLDYLLERAGAE
jgi:geranylgeranyl diphosphate synthase, type II